MSSSPDRVPKWVPEAIANPPPRTPRTPEAAPWHPGSFDLGGPVEAPDPTPVLWRAPDLDLESPPPKPAPEPATAEDVDLAHELGLEEGRKEGEWLARRDLEPVIAALRKVSRTLDESRGQMLHDLETNLCALSMAVAKKVVGREMEADPTLLRDLVKQGLALVKPDAPLVVRMNPEDLEAIGEGNLENLREHGTAIRWSPDPGLERGSFFIDGPKRIVDGRVDDALGKLYERLAYD